ncbi:MAG: hypothetical protein IT168_23065 [Bryobacterales bacterium]|nr:hypothetical protein [Bryobacterales bacterium]
MMRSSVVFVVVAATLCGESLTNFKPSPRRSDHGTVSMVEFATTLMDVEPGSLALHLPQAMMHFHFEEPVWVVGYKTFIADKQGKAPRENYLCHTFVGDQRVMQTEDQEVRGLYSDGYTPEVVLPDGYGVLLPAGETLHWMPMFNNRAETIVRVKMKVELSIIRQRDVKKPLKQLYGTLRSVAVPHLYFVQPGKDERGAEFQLPFDGRIHFMGTHIHPHGVWVQLEKGGETIWRGSMKPGGLTMEVYSSAEGYPVKAGEKFRVSALYENPTQAPVDAMAGLYILYSR